MVRHSLFGPAGRCQDPARPAPRLTLMKLRRVILLIGGGLAGYMTYKVIEVATRPLPPEPVRGVNLRGYGLPIDLEGTRPEDAELFVEQFAAVVERRLAQSGPQRGFRIPTDYS